MKAFELQEEIETLFLTLIHLGIAVDIRPTKTMPELVLKDGAIWAAYNNLAVEVDRRCRVEKVHDLPSYENLLIGERAEELYRKLKEAIENFRPQREVRAA